MQISIAEFHLTNPVDLVKLGGCFGRGAKEVKVVECLLIRGRCMSQGGAIWVSDYPFLDL